MVVTEGDHKVHVIDVRENEIELEASFALDFDRDIATERALPHGLVIRTAQQD